MVLSRRYSLLLAAFFLGFVWLCFCIVYANAAECPTPEPCKILTLTVQEEKLLMQPNGILDTAAQARALDLGQFSVYLKTRIANAPTGELRPTENKPAAAVDTPVK